MILTVYGSDPNNKCTFRNRDRANEMKSDFLGEEVFSCQLQSNLRYITQSAVEPVSVVSGLPTTCPYNSPSSRFENERSKRLHRFSGTFELLFRHR